MTELARMKIVTATFKPLGDRVLIKCDAQQTKVGSIFVPTPVDTEILRGTITAIGPGRWSNQSVYIKTTLQVGDVVYYRRPLADKLEDSGVQYVLTNESDIVAVIQ